MQKLWSLLFGVVLLASLVLFLVAPLFGWWLPKDVSSYGHEVDFLFYVILGLTGFFFILTSGILVYNMYKYIGQPGRKGLFIHGNHRLEMFWTFVPAVILLFIAFTQIGAWERIKYQSRTPPPNMVVEVSARQFEWRIRYPDDILPSQPETWSHERRMNDVHTVNALHVWKGANVKVFLKTRDVIHSFYLPNLRLKQDALPGKAIPVWFNAKEANTHWNDNSNSWEYGYNPNAQQWGDPAYKWDLACAELCGWGHYKMNARLYVHENEEDYKKWLHSAAEEQEQRTARPSAK